MRDGTQITTGADAIPSYYSYPDTVFFTRSTLPTTPVWQMGLLAEPFISLALEPPAV